MNLTLGAGAARALPLAVEAFTLDDPDHRIRHLPVVDEGKLLGIISIGDVVKQRLAEVESEADQLREYITTG